MGQILMPMGKLTRQKHAMQSMDREHNWWRSLGPWWGVR